MRLKLLVLLVLCGVAVQGCGSDDDGPSAPPPSGGDGDGDGDGDSGEGSGGTGGISGVGAGGTGGQDDEDGGAGTGGSDEPNTPTTCSDFEPVPPGLDPDPGMLFNIVTMPDDLAVERVAAAWDGNCVQPALRVALSSGNCPDGDGHELSISLPADGVEASLLVLGQNVIKEESAGSVSVRYTRPGRINPSGEWGTCDEAMGTLDLVGELDLRKGHVVQGRFMLDLTRCDDGGEPSVQQVDGSFFAEVPADLEEVCP